MRQKSMQHVQVSLLEGPGHIAGHEKNKWTSVILENASIALAPSALFKKVQGWDSFWGVLYPILFQGEELECLGVKQRKC